MKIRSGFVSNSSSSSFVVMKSSISALNADRLCEHIGYAKEIGDPEFRVIRDDTGEIIEEGWQVIDQGKSFLCTTSMDNFDLRGFALKHLGIKGTDILAEKHGHW